jgi:hypothetical protein
MSKALRCLNCQARFTEAAVVTYPPSTLEMCPVCHKHTILDGSICVIEDDVPAQPSTDDLQRKIQELRQALEQTAKELNTLKHAWVDYLHNRDNIGWAIEELVRDAETAYFNAQAILGKIK